MKIVLIVIDGLGDKPIKALGNKTPLEAAKTPNLDWLAKNGICGLVQPFKFAFENTPTSEGTHIALFGYENYFLGRGPYEAAGIGMKMKKGDVALRANFATVTPERPSTQRVECSAYGASKKFIVQDRRAGAISRTEPLIKVLTGITIDGVKFLLQKSYGHRAGLILRGEGLSEKIGDGDPGKEGKKVKTILPLEKSKKAEFTARVLNKFLEKAHLVLEKLPENKKRKLPANYLLLRGAGKFRKAPDFFEKYHLKSCAVTGPGIYKGIARVLGMNVIEVEGITGFADTNLRTQFKAVRNLLERYDFIFCHIKAADTFSHKGDFLGKKKFIEKIDQNLKILIDVKNAFLVVTGDHSTPCELRDHSANPLPILIYGKGLKNGEVLKFSEKACEKGTLKKINQNDLMKKILSFSSG